MNIRFLLTIIYTIFVPSLFLVGCSDDNEDDNRAPPVGPNIHGSWLGTFTTDGKPENTQNISATIRQDGDAIMLQTSLEGLGQSLTGTIKESGRMTMIDAFDAEIWTTYQKAATVTDIELDDFTRAPTAEDPQPPLNKIILKRQVSAFF